MSRITLLHFQGSPNCAVAHLALRRKNLTARAVELPIGLHPAILRALGFRRGIVPAARIDGRRVQGSTQIMRALDELVPEPRLFPNPEVAELERWGEEVVQTIPRRIANRLVRRTPRHSRTFPPAGLVGRVPAPVATALTEPTLRFQAWRLKTGDEAELHAALRELGPTLDRIAELVREGRLDAGSPTAADLQIAPQIRMLTLFDDLRPAIERRPEVHAWALAVVPDYPGHVPAVLRPEERERVA